VETKPAETLPFALIRVAYITMHYCLQAVKEFALEVGRNSDNKYAPDAWLYAADASYWAGILNAAWAARKNQDGSATLEFAKRGAAARHAKNYEKRDAIIAAFKSGNFANKDQAATALHQEFEVAWRTAREHLKGL
jgi:hypothetical protein